MSERLDPLTLPLRGSRLIEASAGTGKTWTIAALYLRLVLGHGGEGAAYRRPLLPGEILVMTFTRAATRELSDRIRERLLQAARCFRGETAPPDALLAQLLADYPEGPQRTHAAWRLACAAEAMDDAAVHTIDAWCQRMLREHAFDSRNLFDEELVADERVLLEEAVRDYWRQHVYPLATPALEAALKSWKDVHALRAAVGPLVARLGPGAAEPPALSALCEGALQARAQRLCALKDGWTARVQALREWFAAQFARPDCALVRTRLKPHNVEAWLLKLAQWAADPQQEQPELSPAARERLCRAGMLDASKPGLDLPEHFDAIEALHEALAALPDVRAALLQHAACCVARRVAALKAQSGTYGFADLLQRLDAALQGPDGQRLRARILAQYPVALVDEFQDTSPLQYRLFDALYRPAEDDPAHALLLIGDPKQSIYAFRGADIHSYLRARRATAGRHHVLDTNRRSTHALVGAVNHLFARAEGAHAGGAFLFRQDGGDHPLPFEPVRAHGLAQRLVGGDGAPLPALTLCADATLDAAAGHQQRFAARCADRIVALLNDPGAGFTDGAGTFRRLAPADIAVLVRTGREAEAVRRELRRREVASVYLSDKDSVFAAPEARDLLRWLRAVAAPLDLRLARAAWATALVGLPLGELAQLAADDEAWEARVELLRQLRGVWQRHGVLTLLRQTLHRLALPARWLAEPGGERRLTNVLHIAELLQAAAARLDGEQALVRWLARQVQAQDTAEGDERIVRLESDAALVKVVTIHKSKGLQYPVVFLPFAADCRPVERAGRSFVELADGDGARRLEFGLREEVLAQADRERLREDLRLLYVALTRAEHALWVGVGAVARGRGKARACAVHRSALGQLLGGGQALAEAELLARLRAACQGCDAIAVQEAAPPSPPPGGPVPLCPRDDAPALEAPPEYGTRFERDWAVGSFSGLVKHLGAAAAAGLLQPAPLPVAPLREGDDDDTAAWPAPPPPAAGAPWHRFPRGAYPGNFLHDQLEWLAGERFGLQDNEPLREQLKRRCERQGWQHRAEDVLAWLQEATGVVLPPLGVPLSALQQLLPEMEFWLPSAGLASAAVDALCRRHVLPGRARPVLPERQLRGMLMGFVDLVFEHGGRYWVLDYKSNALGRADADYGRDALERAVAAHRYDVQAALYLLALHRQLRARLGAGYDPAQHLGGAVFFFLRGVGEPQHRGCLHVAPDAALLQALEAALGPAAADGAEDAEGMA